MPTTSERAELIRAARERKGLLPAAVAASIDVSRSMVSEWESGGSGPSFRNMQKLAAFLDIDMLALVEAKPGRRKPPKKQKRVTARRRAA